jgi:hypothetical protein
MARAAPISEYSEIDQQIPGSATQETSAVFMMDLPASWNIPQAIRSAEIGQDRRPDRHAGRADSRFDARKGTLPWRAGLARDRPFVVLSRPAPWEGDRLVA